LKINSQVEPIVREAFAASVAGERERFTAALESVAALGDDLAQDALTLALTVSSSALLSVHDGERPDDEQLTLLGNELADDAEEWGDGITAEDARSFLSALADGLPPELEPGLTAELAFGGGGWLLSSFLREDAKWTAFLDQILDSLESGSAQESPK
jgi:hypothetical protein